MIWASAAVRRGGRLTNRLVGKIVHLSIRARPSEMLADASMTDNDTRRGELGGRAVYSRVLWVWCEGRSDVLTCATRQVGLRFGPLRQTHLAATAQKCQSRLEPVSQWNANGAAPVWTLGDLGAERKRTILLTIHK